MVTGLRWVGLGVALVACSSQPAQAPVQEPAPGAAEPRPAASVAPVTTPQAPEKKPTGRLDPTVIQKAVRAHYGEFRKCYEAGLGRNRDLKGRVSARFVIARDGTVSDVSNGGSDLPDHETISCVLRAFYDIRFPPPEGGIVTVVYPIMLEPG